ncbi:MAG: response regulator [Vicinamibacterales bacterium]
MATTGSRLLVIDDDASALETYRVILTKAGYDVIVASGVEEGLALFRRHVADLGLVLTDMRMPGMSGFEMLAAIRGYPTAIPTVMYSAYATIEAEAAAKRIGAAGFLSGPFWGDDLLAVVERHIGSRHRPAVTADTGSPGCAATRWATIVVPVARAEEDVPTEVAWARAVGKSLTTLKTWCAAADVTASASLDFGRGLRIALRHGGEAVTYENWYEWLGIIESRTLRKFLARGGLRASGGIPFPADFLRNQEFIVLPTLIAATKRLLDLPE